MRQVPQYCIVGLGRLGKHVAHYLTLLGVHYVAWTRLEPVSHLHEHLNQKLTVLLCISDDEIVSFIQNIQTQRIQVGIDPSNPSLSWVHFSGALQTPLAYGIHPLMSFSKVLYSLEIYKSIPLICTGEIPKNLLSDWPNKRYQIPAQQKILYHAWCALVGNGTSLLWHKFESFLEHELSLPREVAKPYCQKILANVLDGAQSSLTGPMVRGDKKTIEKHQNALGDSPQGQLYQAMCSLYREGE